MQKKLKVLFLCTGNACRSQMAEGWARHLKPDTIKAYSAGVIAAGLHPLAVRVMAEAGVDISMQRSKLVEDVAHVKPDYVVTLCGYAQEQCPVFAGATRMIHVGFEDPLTLASTARTEAEALGHFRRIRDEIRAFVATLPGSLTDGMSNPG